VAAARKYNELADPGASMTAGDTLGGRRYRPPLTFAICDRLAMRARELAHRLPPPAELEARSLGVAALDAVLSPEWEYRYFSFDPKWSPTERMASMRNGSGDSYNIVFGPSGTVVRAFDHESELSPWGRDEGDIAEGILDGFPAELRSVIDEPAFRTEGGPATDLTFCAWHTNGASAWNAGPIPDDGSAADLLAVVLDEAPTAYCSYAAEYFERDVPPDVVAAAVAGHSFTLEMCRRLNPEVDPQGRLADLASFGYPTG
jgi:hypothetical protein